MTQQMMDETDKDMEKVPKRILYQCYMSFHHRKGSILQNIFIT